MQKENRLDAIEITFYCMDNIQSKCFLRSGTSKATIAGWYARPQLQMKSVVFCVIWGVCVLKHIEAVGNVASTVPTFISVAGTSHPIQNFTRFFSSAGEALFKPQTTQKKKVLQAATTMRLIPTHSQ